MAHRARCPGVGKADRDVLSCHRIAGVVHHDDVNRTLAPAVVDALAFE